MRRFSFVAGSVILLAPVFGAAQTVRWNDRAANEWTEDTPKVQLYIEGSRSVAVGEPVRVRFSVDQDAYVVVGRVDADGRLTILYPNSSNGRSFVRAGSDVLVRGRRSGSFASFYAFDRFGPSFVFALASYSPLDLSGFKIQDFERIGLNSPFTYANRQYNYRPDEYIERFASWVVYDPNTPYDYDIDFYSVGGSPSYASSLGLCHLSNQMFYDHNDRYESGWGSSLSSGCRGYYNSYISCLGFSYFNQLGCFGYTQPIIVRGPEPIPVTPPVVNPPKKTNYGGDWKPEGVIAEKPGDWRTGEKAAAGKSEDAPARFEKPDVRRGEGEWDNIKSIPARSLDELKRGGNDESRVKSGVAGTTRTERGWAETERGGLRTPRESPAAERYADRETKATRDRSDGGRRLGGSSADSPPSRSAEPRRETMRTPPERQAPVRSEAPPRPASREPSVRAESPPKRSEPVRSEPVRSEPSKGSSTGEERKKPPRD